MGAIFSIIWSVIKAIFGMGANKPSAEAVATGNAAAANSDLAVTKASAVTSAKVAQAEVDAPSTKAQVVNDLNSGSF